MNLVSEINSSGLYGKVAENYIFSSGASDAVEPISALRNTFNDYQPVSAMTGYEPVSAMTGYYTKSEVDTEIGKIGAYLTAGLDASGNPDVANPSTKVIYLTKDSSLSVTDPYTEWIWLSATSAFEIIGETTINLSDYATTAALANKVDKVTGKGLSEEDFTSAYKDKLDSIASGAEVNVQANWSETATASDSYIANKPDLIIPLSSTQAEGGFTAPKYLKVVSAMPTGSNIDPDTIYLVAGTLTGT